MPTFGGQRPAAGSGIQGPFLGTFTGLIPPSPDTYVYPGWALDSSGRVWIHLGPNLWTLSLTVGGAYAPGQGGVIPSAKGTAVAFDGVSGNVLSAFIPASTVSFSMAGFIKSSWPTPHTRPFMAESPENYLQDNDVSAVANITGTSGTGNYGNLPSANAWHLWVVLVSSTLADSAVYVDGSLLAGGGYALSAWVNPLGLAGSGTTATFLACSMARWAFFDGKLLTPANIAALQLYASAGDPVNYDASILKLAPSIYWLMQETVGDTAADDSGNANIGAYSGGFTLGVPGPI